jgi:hypothetical protein
MFVRAGQPQAPESRGVGAQLVSHQQFGGNPCFLRSLRMSRSAARLSRRRGFGRIIGRTTRISRYGDESARCNGSSRLDPPSASSASMLRSTTPSNLQRHLVSRSTLRIFRAGGGERNGGMQSRPVGLLLIPTS